MTIQQSKRARSHAKQARAFKRRSSRHMGEPSGRDAHYYRHKRKKNRRKFNAHRRLRNLNGQTFEQWLADTPSSERLAYADQHRMWKVCADEEQVTRFIEWLRG